MNFRVICVLNQVISLTIKQTLIVGRYLIVGKHVAENTNIAERFSGNILLHTSVGVTVAHGAGPCPVHLSPWGPPFRHFSVPITDIPYNEMNLHSVVLIGGQLTSGSHA